MDLTVRGFRALTPRKQSLFIFLFSFVLSALIFIPFILQDGGYFFYYGDYNAQQIPFYMEANSAIKSGNFLWSFYTDLGSNFIGSYSFYLLGSPFFYISLLFPAKAMSAVLPWLMCFKIAFAGLFAFWYLRRFVRNTEYAFLCALMYAFSSFTVYNFFFNHFTECTAFFPLLLLGLDKLIVDKKRGFFLFAIALCAFCNYYFFIGQCIFLVIYFAFRAIFKSYENLKFRDIAFVILEGLLGIGIACILLVPSLLSVIQIPRATEKLNGWSTIIYDNPQTYANILLAFFFPPEMPAYPNFFSNFGSKWSSVAAWLPLFGMSGVFAYTLRKRKDWLSYILGFLFLISFIPALNASYQLFTNTFYTRWFYMLILLMCVATAVALESISERTFVKGIILTAVITLAIAIPVGLIENPKDAGKSFFVSRLVKYYDTYAAYVLIALICLAVVYILICRVKRNSKWFFKVTAVLLTLTIGGYSIFIIACGRIYSGEQDDLDSLINTNVLGGESIDIPDIQNVRSDVVGGIDNQTLYWQIPGLQAFHSVVPGSITNFYTTLGIKRDVNSKPDTSHVFLRSFLSVKYAFVNKSEENFYMFGYKKTGEFKGFDVYENSNYLPFGFCYEYYCTEEYFYSLIEKEREKMLLRTMVLSDSQIEKYGHLLQPFPRTNYYYFPDSDSWLEVYLRREQSIDTFRRKQNGFEATIALQKPNLVFFSFPYEKGWTATVNGKPVEVLRVQTGFMAVECEAGNNDIEFSYYTPGLNVGIIISMLCLIAGASYTVIIAIYKKENKNVNRRKN